VPRHTVSEDEYLRILNETLRRHPAYSAGMAFHHILPDGPHSYAIVMPASVSDGVQAAQVFDAVAHAVRRQYVCAQTTHTADDQEAQTAERE
jgi:hypothetical protein